MSWSEKWSGARQWKNSFFTTSVSDAQHGPGGLLGASGLQNSDMSIPSQSYGFPTTWCISPFGPTAYSAPSDSSKPRASCAIAAGALEYRCLAPENETVGGAGYPAAWLRNHSDAASTRAFGSYIDAIGKGIRKVMAESEVEAAYRQVASEILSQQQ